MQLARLRALPGSERCIAVSIQGLHRFYSRKFEKVVASWMTRQDRELAIADNAAYFAASLDAVRADWPAQPVGVFVGFSQGVAAAYRAAVAFDGRAAVISVGGDVPPELSEESLTRLSRVWIGRGERDDLYRSSQFYEDIARLKGLRISLETSIFDGAHEWPANPELLRHFFLSVLG